MGRKGTKQIFEIQISREIIEYNVKYYYIISTLSTHDFCSEKTSHILIGL